MKKILTTLLVLALAYVVGYRAIASSYNNNGTISFDEYLHLKKSIFDFHSLKLNKNGDVTFKNRIIVKDDGAPLNKNTAFSTLELRVLFKAQKIKPRKGCDPSDTKSNGSLGCYIDTPDD